MTSRASPSLQAGSPRALPPFAAIDFETANSSRASAIAVAVVRVEDGLLTERMATLLRPTPEGSTEAPRGYPPPDYFHPRNTQVHGLSRVRVLRAPTFAQAWPRIARVLRGTRFLVAHNAPFDRSVLKQCAQAAALPVPEVTWLCTVQLSKRALTLPSHRLNVVCAHFGIPLDHHEALSDATGCAKITQRLYAQAPDLFAHVVDEEPSARQQR